MPRNVFFKITKAGEIRIFETIRKGPIAIKTLNFQVAVQKNQKKKILLIGKCKIVPVLSKAPSHEKEV